MTNNFDNHMRQANDEIPNVLDEERYPNCLGCKHGHLMNTSPSDICADCDDRDKWEVIDKNQRFRISAPSNPFRCPICFKEDESYRVGTHIQDRTPIWDMECSCGIKWNVVFKTHYKRVIRKKKIENN